MKSLLQNEELQGQVEGPAEADRGLGRAPTGRMEFHQQLSSANEEKGWEWELECIQDWGLQENTLRMKTKDTGRKLRPGPRCEFRLP